MSIHNYTNPAFCQQSEFYSATQNSTTNCLKRSESTRSFRTYKRHNAVHLPPKPGPKPKSQNFNNRGGSGRYALVPVEELSRTNKNRYAVIPGIDPKLVQRLSKSTDNLDAYESDTEKNNPLLFQEESDTFKSLPPIITHDEPRLKAAFSSDFGSKSFVLFDQQNNQRYAVVPTDENEEIVDDNHEIIQMHNGRKHRYAVIPDVEEEEEEEVETCLDVKNHNYAVVKESPHKNSQILTPQKLITTSTPIGTPTKNAAATQKLHELLSTPRKQTIQRHNSTSQRYSRRYQSQPSLAGGIPKKDLTPQRLEYDVKKPNYIEARTTAVITPRVAQSCGNDELDNSSSKNWNNNSIQKVANATATIGAVSLMLILGGAMNSGLCLYMVSYIGRSYYLDVGIISGFAAVGLGILGFKSRHCHWLPNRNYISGFILVTVFSLLKCCGLLVLLALHPYPGTALHDITTGVILGLSSLTLLLISLGVITSRWCRAPPPDNRIDVY